MSAEAIPFPRGDRWKDVTFVQSWKAGRRKKIESEWRGKYAAPLLTGTALSAAPDFKLAADLVSAVELVQWESESLVHRARRLESHQAGPKAAHPSGRSRHQVPVMIGKDGQSWILAPAVARAKDHKLEKSKAMYDAGLEKKAQRELACGLIGGEVVCRSGHAFRVSYECGNRYCVTCGPRGALRLFAKYADRLLFVGTRLLMCGVEECAECNQAIGEKRLPHWPPAHGVKPRIVVAKLDFTLRNTGETPGPEMMRTLNGYIKKFCRAMEKRFRIRRREYGLAYCDELGGNNTNAHAHGLYIGPWLPQEHKELSRLWSEITGGSFIISIKYARNLATALHHAVKYPAKFAERSTPRRLAELERIFHRVRRFHALAAFYAPEVPEEEDPPGRRCPLCDDVLSEVKIWQTVAELDRRGLRDVSEVKREIARARGLTGAGPPSNTIKCALSDPGIWDPGAGTLPPS